MAADVYISQVHYNATGSHIDQLWVADNHGTTMGPWRSESRAKVVSDIALLKRQYYTAPPKPGGGLLIGAKVEVVPVNGVSYLRTDRNGTPKDNLGNLPTY
jgi:hypothetical protein